MVATLNRVEGIALAIERVGARAASSPPLLLRNQIVAFPRNDKSFPSEFSSYKRLFSRCLTKQKDFCHEKSRNLSCPSSICTQQRHRKRLMKTKCENAFQRATMKRQSPWLPREFDQLLCRWRYLTLNCLFRRKFDQLGTLRSLLTPLN